VTGKKEHNTGSKTMFTEFVNQLDPINREAFNRTIVLGMDTPEAASLRQCYYKSVLRKMGKNVTIGTNVKIVNPQWVELGDDVLISDGCTLIARGKPGIKLQKKCP